MHAENSMPPKFSKIALEFVYHTGRSKKKLASQYPKFFSEKFRKKNNIFNGILHLFKVISSFQLRLLKVSSLICTAEITPKLAARLVFYYN